MIREADPGKTAARPALELWPTMRQRLDAVDGLRACAALWVVLFHVRAFSGAHLGPFDLIARSGSAGVSLFLVLSGFCLYLPIVRAGIDSFEPVNFLRRRARRLLPAYYASLLVVLLWVALAAGRLGFPRLDTNDVLTELAAHITMTHSLFPSTFYTLNGAYWSLALEWQLYLTLPLVIAAVRRFGFAWVVVAVCAANIMYRGTLAVLVARHAIAADSALTSTVLPNAFPGRWSEFALGMVAAELYTSGRMASWGQTVRLSAIPLVLLAVVTAGNPFSHLFVGMCFFALLCTVLAGDTLLHRVLCWRPLVSVGVMSYSLYLVHQPMVEAVALFFREHGDAPAKAFLEVLVFLPVVLVAAWVLYVVVERRTLHPTAAIKPSGAEALLMAPLQFGRQRWRRRARADA